MTIRVFLVDDHELVRGGERSLLERAADIAVIGECGSAAEAVRLIPALKPDLAIVDVRLPDGSGIDVCRHIRSVDASIATLIVTSYDDDQAFAAAVLAGASGFIIKSINGAGLVEAVHRVAAGDNLLDTDRRERLRTAWRQDADGDARLRELSPQERRILDLVAAGMTNRQIGEAVHLAEKTVKNYVTSILAKMGVQTRTQAAVYLTLNSKAETSEDDPRGPGST
jgi:two-component system, NarL family, response regulator DevR